MGPWAIWLPQVTGRRVLRTIFGKLIGVSRGVLIHEIWGCYHRKERRKSFGLKSRMIGIMHLTRSYHWSKVSLVRIVEDWALGNLAAAGDREESASHHDWNHALDENLSLVKGVAGKLTG